ncbi:carbohydrate ABC transporter permease [Paenibacillus eucommiae]|uniref:Multiple sugar transport system permease protein n=1 Tax=Paenibacillus eucommiae TaxID=1355755 RepID=A0ABS4J1E4_9BACL|nr:sugar ABC transporter permease [Paenibacillus eucommiae]MBP1993613.1 multiple sugar transport system permease protein [Paenibacillus eucommiae]
MTPMLRVVRGLRQLAFDCWHSRTAYLFIAPFMISFVIFIIIPVCMAMGLSFTDFDGFSFPSFVGFQNYIDLITQDHIFQKYALPNTFKFALLVGPGGYLLSFFFAWLIYQLPKKWRDVYTLAFYAPSLAGGVALTVVWAAAFSGDRVGYLNNFLLNLDLINQPVIWLQDPRYLLNIMIIVTLWTSFSIGFLAMMGGLATVNPELYEAGRIDGIRNRLQEIYYITIPSMKPQMIFSAIMAIVTTLRSGSISTALSGMPITPQYSGHLIINHVDDYAFIRFEFGYASAVSVVLLVMSYLMMQFFYKILRNKEG